MATTYHPHSRLQYLKKVLAVQTIVLEHQGKGYPQTYIFKTYIRDRFYISERTCFRYMGINAKREIKQLEKEISLLEE